MNENILLISSLVMASVLFAACASRLGISVLMVFLVSGMVLGAEHFQGLALMADPGTAYALGNIALAVILLDGGLHTQARHLREGAAAAGLLATVGVVVTVAVTALFAVWLLGIDWKAGFLMGAVVGSTDAAAIFSLFHTSRLNLKPKIEAVLEMESGLNDPMAILLTALATAMLSGATHTPRDYAWMFGEQLVLGAVLGGAGGWLLAWLLRRVSLPTGLYPLLALSGGLTVFGATNLAGGSGYLAIYVLGVVAGNQAVRDLENIRRVNHGFAWMAQIGLFLTLGLLARPDRLWEYALPALGISVALTFVARPLAVLASLMPLRVPWRKQAFIAMTGVRGAVPIVLSLHPLIEGVPCAAEVLDVAFFVVAFSLLVQNGMVPFWARVLGASAKPRLEAEQRVGLLATLDSHCDLVGYRVVPEGRLMGNPPTQIPLPEDILWAAVVRNGQPLDPASAGLVLRAGDYVFLVVPESRHGALSRLLHSRPRECPDRVPGHSGPEGAFCTCGPVLDRPLLPACCEGEPHASPVPNP